MEDNKFIGFICALSLISNVLLIIILVNVCTINGKLSTKEAIIQDTSKIEKDVSSDTSKLEVYGESPYSCITKHEVIEPDDTSHSEEELELPPKQMPYKVYHNYYSLPVYKIQENHPYLEENDLVEYGCPECGYQLWCFDSHGTSASAELRCTNCDWKSYQVYIENCEDEKVAKEILLELYDKGELIQNFRFETASEYYDQYKSN